MIGLSPSFFLFLFRLEFPVAEFVPLPFAPVINGIVVGGSAEADGSVSFAPFIVSSAGVGAKRKKDFKQAVSALSQTKAQLVVWATQSFLRSREIRYD
ncbi:hypothetical protein F4819DRAFT_465729 [Hypoxylon fuscum]|nr:hypothetical protein F4819DRAFT_465729 [Hypoxylon fuscum]